MGLDFFRYYKNKKLFEFELIHYLLTDYLHSPSAREVLRYCGLFKEEEYKLTIEKFNSLLAYHNFEEEIETEEVGDLEKAVFDPGDVLQLTEDHYDLINILTYYSSFRIHI